MALWQIAVCVVERRLKTYSVYVEGDGDEYDAYYDGEATLLTDGFNGTISENIVAAIKMEN